MHLIWSRLRMGSLLLLAACAGRTVELKHTSGGAWELTCGLPMDGCVREIESVCKDKRYRILRGMSEMRLRDAPPYSTEYRTSRLEFVCSDDGAQMLTGPSSESIWRSATRACSSGDTRSCVGPAACGGGQVCRPDGTGFGPCDCGALKAPGVDAGPSPTASAGAGAVPAPTVDAGSPDAQR